MFGPQSSWLVHGAGTQTSTLPSHGGQSCPSAHAIAGHGRGCV